MYIVGHRGYPEKYPENSLTGIKAALEQGVQAIEFDIQMSKDGVPVVVHDQTLDRVTAQSGVVMDLPWEELQSVSVHEPQRFGDQFSPEPLASLAQVVECLQAWPDVAVFPELKAESLTEIGRAAMVQAVMDILSPIVDRCILISFDLEAIILARHWGFPKIGWVLSYYNSAALKIAQQVAPDCLISDIKLLPPTGEPLWSGSWEWFVYDIVDGDLARECYERDIRWLESWNPVKLLNDPQLRGKLS